MKRLVSLVGVGVLAATTFATSASAGGRPLTADLSSANEVPPSGPGASGDAELTVNPGQGEVCFDITANGLAGAVLAAHVHDAPAGTNGGVVVNLDVAAQGLSGCVDGVDLGLLLDIMQNPAEFYVNVHTTAVPSGEIRGQLSK